jgi:outer membrane protein
MNKKVTILSVMLILLMFSMLTYAQGMVGYIDLKRLVNESEMGKAAKKEIIKLKEEKEAILKTRLKEIEELKTNISKSSDSPDSDEMQKNNLELNSKYKEYQRIEADAKEDITLADRELVSKILKEADGALKMVAKKKKYVMIIKDPNAVGYLDPSIDITDEVLNELSKK